MFSDQDDEAGSKFNSTSEKDIVTWMFRHPNNFIDYLFYEELEISKNYQPFFEVKDPIIKDTTGPGDIDILLIDKNQPQYSIAFQVKRVKATISETNDGAILKTSSIGKGIIQTKYMFDKYKFHKNYLMLIMANDSSSRKNVQQMFRYAKPDEKRIIYEHSGFGDLPEETGIYIFEINQPSINDINHTAVLSAKELRKAKPIEQMNDTTLRIQRYLESKFRIKKCR